MPTADHDNGQNNQFTYDVVPTSKTSTAICSMHECAFLIRESSGYKSAAEYCLRDGESNEGKLTNLIHIRLGDHTHTLTLLVLGSRSRNDTG